MALQGAGPLLSRPFIVVYPRAMYLTFTAGLKTWSKDLLHPCSEYSSQDRCIEPNLVASPIKPRAKSK
jgi:hypothetical protein